MSAAKQTRVRAVLVINLFHTLVYGSFVAGGLWLIPQLTQDTAPLTSNLSALWVVLLTHIFTKTLIDTVDASYEAALHAHNR